MSAAFCYKTGEMTMKIGMIQMSSGMDKQANLRRAAECVKQCAGQGTQMVVLPEIFNSPYSNDYFADYAEPCGGESWQALSHMASENAVWLVGGSIPERDGQGKIYNTSFVFDDRGSQKARHRKMHLFDIDVKDGQKFKESDTFTAGDEITVFDSPWGKIGLCICFDFRFPELARLMVLEGARAIIVPAAFNMTTGPAHWELMFRQRAVDGQCFTVGVAPARDEQGVYVSYGNSMAVSPWGKVLCRAGAEEWIHVETLDLEEVDAVRQQLPLLSARRTDLYRLEKLEK